MPPSSSPHRPDSQGLAAPERCLTPEEALSFVSNEPNAPPAETVHRHLERCARCRVVVAEAASAITGEEVGRSMPVRTLGEGERILGRYEIVRFMARGGMGEVYEALDTVLHERVALKTLLPTSLDDQGSVERVLGEVRLARKVTHFNVCRILEFGVHRRSGSAEAIPFLTMQFLTGETLGQRLARQGPLPAARAHQILREVVAALGAIHDAGIVHRDFKSDNVFLVTDESGASERAVVMDFGLARGVDANLLRSWSSARVAGTPDYMAPEQVEGKPPSPAFDIYALGIVAFEMLTGKRPFVGSSPLLTAMLRLHKRAPSPSSLVPGLSSAWDSLVGRCLEREPARRFGNIGQVADALEAVGRPRRSPALWLATALAAALGGSAAWVLVDARGPTPPADRRVLVTGADARTPTPHRPPLPSTPASPAPVTLTPAPPPAAAKATAADAQKRAKLAPRPPGRRRAPGEDSIRDPKSPSPTRPQPTPLLTPRPDRPQHPDDVLPPVF